MTPFHPRDTVPAGVFFLFPNREGGLLNSNDYVAFFSAILVYFWGYFRNFGKELPDNFQNKAGGGGPTLVWKKSKNSSESASRGFPKRGVHME